MPDLLIRDLDPVLRHKLEASAARNGRSLSKEAAALIGSALGADDVGGTPRDPIGKLLELGRQVQLPADEEKAFFDAVSPGAWRSRPAPDFEDES